VKKSWVAFCLGILAIVGGYFIWTSYLATPVTMTEPGGPSSKQSSFRWTIGPEPSARSSGDPSDTESSESLGLEIPGQVKFSAGSAGETVALRVTVLKIKRPLPSKFKERLKTVSAHLSVKEVLEKLRQTGISKSTVNRHLLEKITRTIHAGPQGQFTLVNAPAGVYRVESVDPMWKGTSSRAFLQLPENIRPLTLTLRPSGTVVGTVHTTDGRPLSEVEVMFEGSRATRETDEDGRFVVEGIHPDRPLNFFSLHKRGFQPIEVDQPPLKGRARREMSFTMKEGTYLEVNVLKPGGEPVRTGAVSALRADDRTMRDDIPKRVNYLNGKEQVRFEGLKPGSVRLGMRSSPFFVEPAVVGLEPGETKMVTLEAVPADTYILEYVREDTQKPVSGIVPSLEVTGKDDRVYPGKARVVGKLADGRYRIRVHPNAEELMVHSQPLNNQLFRSTTTRWTLPRSDTLSVELMPETVTESTPGDMAQYDLTFKGIPDSLREGATGRLVILNANTGRIVARRGGSLATDWSIPLPNVPTTWYVSLRTDDGSRVAVKTIQPSRTSSPKTVTMKLGRPATVSGRLRISGNDSRDLSVGVALQPPHGPHTTSSRLSVHVPDDLRTTVDAKGNFTLNVPARTDAYLVVVPTGSEFSSGTELLLKRHLSGLSSGDTRDIPMLNLP
jgi:hypothetical protein